MATEQGKINWISWEHTFSAFTFFSAAAYFSVSKPGENSSNTGAISRFSWKLAVGAAPAAFLSALCVKPASRKFSLTPGLLALSLPLPPSVVLASALDAAAADEPCASSSSDSPRAVSDSRGNVSAGRQANLQTSNQASLIRKSAPPVPSPRFLCDAE